MIALALVAGIWARQREAERAPKLAFTMCIGGPPKARNQWNEVLLAAVARSLRPEEIRSLEEALTEAATHWEARANPMLEDLEDGDPDAPIEAWSRTAPSFLRTAQSAARTRLCADDGFCVTPSSKDCSTGTTRATGKDEGRARFLLWPWGHALRLSMNSPDEARMISDKLRKHARTSKRIAVVIGHDDIDVTKAEPYVRIRELWKRVAVLRSVAKNETMTPEAFRPNIDDPRELIVMPRLETINDMPAFEAEITAVVMR